MVLVQSGPLPVGAAQVAAEKARLAEAGLLGRPAAGVFFSMCSFALFEVNFEC